MAGISYGGYPRRSQQHHAAAGGGLQQLHFNPTAPGRAGMILFGLPFDGGRKNQRKHRRQGGGSRGDGCELYLLAGSRGEGDGPCTPRLHQPA
jgi:hypothetical protein